ncbi:amino acid adenylation domain-containing protein [Pseudoalteromonas sp. MMG013]|uniref:non-ribosomal peptide synthetase n=1 Tax=Pseudoalteromonas sp. MMG013 TaxID=2822687 RepID=UPI001B3669A1|nr:amino acid adenylation domain-containing protein [Pseudoalteromonas sp. MMG013]
MEQELLEQALAKGIHIYVENGKLRFKAPKGAMTPELKENIKANMDAMIKLVEGAPRQPTNKRSLQSYSQQRLWFLNMIQSEDIGQYNIPFAYKTNGRLNSELLFDAVDKVIERHEVLRTSFSQSNDTLCQEIEPEYKVNRKVINLSSAGERQDSLLHEFISAEVGYRFNLEKSPLFRFSLVELDSDSQIIICVFHHIIMDGWSAEIFVKEMMAFYHAALKNDSAKLPDINYQYSDFANWQRNRITQGAIDSQINYWLEQLKDAPPVHKIPLDYPRKAQQTFNGKTLSATLNKEQLEQIKTLCRPQGITTNAFFYSILTLYLARLSGDKDIVLGTVVSGRQDVRFENLLGFFVNTLVLRHQVDSNVSFSQHLAQCQSTLLDAYANEFVPFDLIVEKLQPDRTLATSPLFQLCYNYSKNVGVASQGEAGVGAFELMNLGNSTSKFEITFNIIEQDDQVTIALNYNDALFSEQRVHTYLNGILILINQAVNSAEQNAYMLEVLSDNERKLLDEWQLGGENPTPSLFPCTFYRHVNTHENRIAVEDKHTQLTYAQLDLASSILAVEIRRQGVKQGDIVAISLERTSHWLVAILAVWKLGAAYTPLDYELNEERCRFIVENTQSPIVITDEVTNSKIASLCRQTYLLGKEPVSMSEPFVPHDAQADDLAYVIYTSGSTGKPKGVMIEHKSLASFLHGMRNMLGVGDSPKGSWWGNVGFDVSVLESLLPLYCAGQVFVIHKQTRLQPEQFVQCLDEHQITLSFIHSSMIEPLTNAMSSSSACCASLQHVVVGAEPIVYSKLQAMKKIRPTLTIHNGYGPTETTVVATGLLIDENQDFSDPMAPIGVPLPGYRTYILNEKLCPVTVGAIGELYIAGDTLARGYLGLVDTTKHSFIESIYGRIYKTGDLVRYLPDGNLAFIGRVDDQVKVRGYRIELGEVESQLVTLETIDSAVVIAKEIAGTKQLIGYIKPNLNLADEVKLAFVTQIKFDLQTKLPEYMIPTILKVVTDWPLTNNGKIDKKALSDMELGDLLSAEEHYVAPESKLEQALQVIWSSILNIETDRVSTTANFFALGGHSLLSIKLIEKIKAQFQVTLQVIDIFNHISIKEQALFIEQKQCDTGSENQQVESIYNQNNTVHDEVEI